MKAIRIHVHGGSDVLKIDTIEQPKVGHGEVLVKVKYAALNHLDIFVREGFPGIPLPVIPGSDAAGIVQETGKGVTKFKPGDEVLHIPFRIPPDDPLIMQDKENLSDHFTIPGEHSDGVQAEYISVAESFLMHKPQAISLQEAAAFPLASLTAYHMLIRKASLQKGDWVLVYGASSGIGSAAIQIAKRIGAHVITTVGSAEKGEMARGLGADHIIEYSKEAIGKTAKKISGGIDVVFEHTGAKTWKDSLRCLKTGGKIVTCGATTGPNIEIDLRPLFIKHQQIIGSTMGTLADMQAVYKMVQEGALRPVLGKVFPFEDVHLAHNWLEEGRHFGKVLLEF